MRRKILIVLSVLFFSLVFAKAEAGTMKMSWSANTEPDVIGYRIYWAFTRQPVVNKTATMIDVGNKTSYCLTVADTSNSVIFIGVAAYGSTPGDESDTAVGYLLFGDVEGTHNDGVPYTSARVDGLDVTTLGVNFGLSVTHPSYNCSSNFAIQLPTPVQKSDLHKDGGGRIDGFDLVELGLRFSNAAN